MNTTLLIAQILVAIIASAIIVPAIQKVKGWLPSPKLVEPVSVVLSFAIGFLVAVYYNGYDLIAALWVGFYSVIGAEAIYRLLAEKLATYTDKKDLYEGLTSNEETVTALKDSELK